jgi:hypothetical protein
MLLKKEGEIRMDYNDDNYEPLHGTEEGSNYGLYFCPICQHDTLHEVTNVEYDNYDILCMHCGTTSVTRVDYFDSYEDESIFWDHEIAEFMGDDGELYI